MHPIRPIRLLSLLLLALLLSAPPVSRADDAADDAGVYVYVPQPAHGQALTWPESWTYEIDVYATLDEETPLTLTLLPDLRVEAAAALIAGEATCGASSLVVCRGQIRRWHPVTVWLLVIPRVDAIPCPPLELMAQASAGGHTARMVHAASGRSCVYAPLVSGGA